MMYPLIDIENRASSTNSRKGIFDSIEETIKKTESDVVKYQDILNRAKYDKLTDSLRLNGVTLDDVINALNNGNIQPLQVKVQPKDAADEEIGGISHG